METQKLTATLLVSILTFSLAAFFTPTFVNASTPTCTSLKSTLRTGSRNTRTNTEVTKLQDFLNSQGYLKTEATGYFGSMTEKAVRDFQAKEGIQVIGIVGPMTRLKINTISCALIAPEKTVIVPPAAEPVPPIEMPVAPVQKKLPYSSSDFLDWNIAWGNVSTTSENVLNLKANEGTNGAQIILANSNEWTNYKLTVNLFVKQATVTLISRYVDENNFLGCTFSGKYVEIIQKVNGQTSVVAFTTVNDLPYSLFFHNDLNLAMRVSDKSVGCSLLGSEDNVTFNGVDASLLKGGIGIQTWVNTVNIANIDLKSIKVISN